ncbi:hypothetical protein K438DRAFT_2096913 [Mycena galopus ATCC 62051]|nr:hypothetical protein K438DRAFT_2096913 [Mycena galopus ATCC 62051]
MKMEERRKRGGEGGNGRQDPQVLLRGKLQTAVGKTTYARGGAQEFGESRSRASIVRSYFRINPALAHVEKVNAPTHPTGLKLAQASDVIPWCSCGHDLFIHGEEGRRRGGIPKTSTTPRGTPQMNRCDGCPLEGEVGTTIRFGDRVTVEEIADYLFRDISWRMEEDEDLVSRKGGAAELASVATVTPASDPLTSQPNSNHKCAACTEAARTREHEVMVSMAIGRALIRPGRYDLGAAGDETGSARPRLSWAEKKGDWQCVAMQLGFRAA